MEPVIITTAHRGVFFGYVEPLNGAVPDSLTLHKAQMCVYWPAENHGVLGLAAQGPLKGARVSPPIPRFDLKDITGIMHPTDTAVKRWEVQPWS